MTEQLSTVLKTHIVRQSPDMIRRNVEVMHSYKIGFRDSCITASLMYLLDLKIIRYVDIKK